MQVLALELELKAILSPHPVIDILKGVALIATPGPGTYVSPSAFDKFTRLSLQGRCNVYH